MTTISRARFEAITRRMVDALAAGPVKHTLMKDVTKDFVGKGKVVEIPAEDKAKFERNSASAPAEEAGFEAFKRERGITDAAAYYAAETYTKFGKMSTEDKEAYVQQKLAQFDVTEAHHAKRQQEIAESNVPATPTGQAGAENPTGTPVANYFRYEESHEMYLSNISTLSLNHAKTQLGLIELKIENREDVGVNVHGRYGDQEISDLNTYLAALKDYISKLDIGAVPMSGEAAKGTASTGGQR